MESEGEIQYRLNDRDEIVFVNDSWNAFAADNGGEHLSGANVLRRPLWGFISDRTTQLLYQDILARVRRGHSVRFTLRCDSPSCRRHLEMNVSGADDGTVDFRVRTILEEPREPQPFFEPHRAHAGEPVTVCGWCKRLRVDGRWIEVEEAVTILGLFERSVPPDATHGICGDCYSRIEGTLRSSNL